MDITSARAQRAIRAAGALSAGVSLVLIVCAYATLYHRGLLNTGVLILLCIMNVGVGGFAYRQPAFPRRTILFGLILATRPHTMVEPGWSIVSVLGTLVLIFLVITTT